MAKKKKARKGCGPRRAVAAGRDTCSNHHNTTSFDEWPLTPEQDAKIVAVFVAFAVLVVIIGILTGQLDQVPGWWA